MKLIQRMTHKTKKIKTKKFPTRFLNKNSDIIKMRIIKLGDML